MNPEDDLFTRTSQAGVLAASVSEGVGRLRESLAFMELREDLEIAAGKRGSRRWEGDSLV